mgnify:CR=1 FL=1
MPPTTLRLTLGLLAAAALALHAGPASAADDRYIVILEDGTSLHRHIAEQHADGNTISRTFNGALDGFVVRLTPAEATALRADPATAIVERDRPVTIDDAATARRVVAEAGLEACFRAIVVSEEEGIRKPSPAVFRKAASLLGEDPAHCIHVGDTFAEDVEGALGVGDGAVQHLLDDLGRRAGSMLRVHRTVPAPADLEAPTGELVAIVRHVADVAAALGDSVRAGQFIICGALTGPMFLESNETRLDYALDPVGSVSVTFSI